MKTNLDLLQVLLFTLLLDIFVHEIEKNLIRSLGIIIFEHVVIDEQFHFHHRRFFDFGMKYISEFHQRNICRSYTTNISNHIYMNIFIC